MQDEFKPLVEEAAARCRGFFLESLAAIYLHGSVAMGDAVPYLSDLDSYVVISREVSSEDRRRLRQMESELQQKYRMANGVHLATHSERELREDAFARFILKYNALRFCGSDVIGRLEADCATVLTPDAQMAKGRLPFARQCFRDALNGRQPMCTGEIPADPYYAVRKFARYFVVIEGAYFLMSQREFVSFEKREVLERLYAHAKGFENELELSSRVLDDPARAGIPHKAYLKRVRPLVEWMFDSIERF